MKLSLRIWPARYMEDDSFAQLRSLLLPYSQSMDELQLIPEFFAVGYTPLETFSEWCRTIASRVKTLTEDGFRVGINTFCIGHFNDAWDWIPAFEGQQMVGHNGIVAVGSFCPNDQTVHRYLSEKYRLLAETGAQFIWVDDDARIHHHPPAEFPCFCPTCLKIFNDAHRTAFTREELVSLMESEDGAETRHMWVEHNITSMETMLGVIERAVHGVDPKIELGLMTGPLEGTTYTGAAYDRWMGALKAVKGRPGGGFYDDTSPVGMLIKGIECARQQSLYPGSVTDIQYELETYPQQRLMKSKRALITESTIMLANGMNGIAAHILKSERGHISDYADWLEALSKAKPLWEAMDLIAGGFVNQGCYPALSTKQQARRKLGDGWFKYSNGGHRASILHEIGIPFSMQPDAACAVILSGEMPQGYTREELIAMLSGGVLLDGRALELLIEMGLGEYCGVSVGGKYNNGILEQNTEDELNGPYTRERRDARITASFTATSEYAFSFKPVPGADVRTVCELISYTEQNLGPAFTLYENSLGGRAAVHGYAPWMCLYSAAKRSQVINAIDWISRGTLPVMIRKSCSVVPYIKSGDHLTQSMMLLVNASLDDSEEIEVEVRTTANRVFELNGQGEEIAVSPDRMRREGNSFYIKVSNIKPWDFAVLHLV